MTDYAHTMTLDEIPADADRYGPVSADEAAEVMFVTLRGSSLRWAGSATTNIRYALGHHTLDALNADRAGRSERVWTYVGQGWERCYRHEFTCPDPGGAGCDCNPENLPVVFNAVNVPEGTPDSYPVTAVVISKNRPGGASSPRKN